MTFQPGQSGNPARRPRGSRNKKTLLLLAQLRKVLGMGKVGGDPAMRRYVERILAPSTPKRIAARRRRRSLRRSLPESAAARCAASQQKRREGLQISTKMQARRRTAGRQSTGEKKRNRSISLRKRAASGTDAVQHEQLVRRKGSS